MANGKYTEIEYKREGSYIFITLMGLLGSIITAVSSAVYVLINGDIITNETIELGQRFLLLTLLMTVAGSCFGRSGLIDNKNILFNRCKKSVNDRTLFFNFYEILGSFVASLLNITVSAVIFVCSLVSYGSMATIIAVIGLWVLGYTTIYVLAKISSDKPLARIKNSVEE